MRRHSAPHRPTSLLASLLCAMLAAFLLAGCAAQTAFREGKELVAQDHIEEGLGRFRNAMDADPQNHEYREAWLQTRERSVYNFVAQGDRLAAAGQRSEAEKLYRRALAIDPGAERARSGLNNLERDQRHDKWLNQAAALLAARDVSGAQQMIASVLAENPQSEAARRLQTSLPETAAAIPQPAPGEATLAAAYRKKVSIEFKDVPLKQIFEVLSRSAGLNFLFDKEVRTDQKASVFLRNSTIESAVNYLLLTNQLDQQVMDSNTVLIYPNTALKQRDYQEMVIKTFFLANVEAKSMANTLKTILKTRDIVVDEKLNLIVVRDSPQAIRLAEKLVAVQDVPEPEVMLELEVIEITRTRLLDLGIQWPVSMTLTPLSLSPQATTTSGASSSSSPSTTTATTTPLTLYDLLHQSKKTIGVGNPALTVNANAQDSDVNLLANPRIRARNREKAKILIGQRVPNITSTATSTGFVSESINYVDVGLTLNVEPTIHLDDDVAIKVSLEVSNIIGQIKTAAGSVAYQIGTRTASTVLRLKDGENQVLAGLINDEDRRASNMLPGLGEIPILGHLFGSTSNDRTKTEIVLSITPHLVRNIRRPQAAQAEFLSGTENRLRPGLGGAVQLPPAGAPSLDESLKRLRELQAGGMGQPYAPAPAAASTSAPVSPAAPAAPPATLPFTPPLTQGVVINGMPMAAPPQPQP